MQMLRNNLFFDTLKFISYKKLLLGIISAGLLFFFIQLKHSEASQPKAAIIDHLSISQPNPAFAQECSAILKQAGFTVDYYPGEKVTVELYRNLPTYEYDLIVLRVHSSYVHEREHPSLAMYTSEPYSTKRYVYEQLRSRISRGYLSPYHEGDPAYLVITEKFIQNSMNGRFKNTLIIMMGCGGIKKGVMATAFIEKGASAYIGWDGPVSALHTDRATLSFLKHLLIEKQTIIKAVGKTMQEIGREPQSKSTLLFWPINAGNLNIQTLFKTPGNPDL